MQIKRSLPQKSAGPGVRFGFRGPCRRLVSAATYRWSGGKHVFLCPKSRLYIAKSILTFSIPFIIKFSEGGGRKRESLLDNVETAAPSEEEDRLARLKRRREERRRLREEALAGDAAQPRGQKRPSNGTAVGFDASEWGPSEAVPPDYNEYGWAEESWASANSETRRSRSSLRSEEDSLGDGWGQQANQRERRERQSGASASSSPSRPSRSDGDLEDPYYEDEAYEGDESDEMEDGKQYGGPGRRSYRSMKDEPIEGEPDIALLSPQELERVLPVVPFSAQANYFNGGAAQAVQRWGASLALTVLLSKIAVLAASTLTWPLWWPWAQAASKNYSLRKQSGYAGLWRTQVLEVEARGRPRPPVGGDGSSKRRPSSSMFSTMRTTRVVLGDPEGAQTEFVLPQDARYELVQPGQPAELIVLSDTPTFDSFKAVKDVYLPDCGLWLSEYPYLDRTEFLELSLEVEREAMAEAEGWSNSADGPQQGSDGGEVKEESWQDGEYDYARQDGDGDGYEDQYYDDSYPPQPPPRN